MALPLHKETATFVDPNSMPQRDELWQDTPDYTEFKARIFKKTGIDLNLYKQPQMHRRLKGMLERVNAADFVAYYALLERDPDEYAAFLDRMTINVSELFRNPEKWQEIRTKIIPALLKHRNKLRIWSAGCSYGAEPYSLAILLDQVTPGVAHTIHATDIDRNILRKAQEGRFTRTDVKNLDQATISKYMLYSEPPNLMKAAADIHPCYQVKPEIRARVSFRQHNLLADKFESDYDLICCRNVVIYFTEEAKDKLYVRFQNALRPGGMLFVGGTERIFNYREIGFDSRLPFFYERTT